MNCGLFCLYLTFIGVSFLKLLHHPARAEEGIGLQGADEVLQISPGVRLAGTDSKNPEVASSS